MAPLLGAYFPSLDVCFSGDAQLISWNAVHLQIISIEDGSYDLDGLVPFINSSESQRILKNPLHPFPPASPETTAAFESIVGSCSSALTSQKQVDLGQIKSDALWLSKKCNIDEVSALRIVVLQWQGQSAAQLLTKFSEEEVTSLQDAVGIGGVSQPAGHARIVSALQKHRGDLNPRPEGLSEEDGRHLKIWLTYLSERQNILSTSRRLVCLSLKHVLPACLNGYARAEKISDEPPLEEFCRSQYKIPAEGDELSLNELISVRDCTDAISTRMRNLGAGSGFLADDINGDIENAWITYHLEELLQILQILYQSLQTTNEFVSDTLLVSWLRLMVDYNFLEGLCPVTPQQLALYPPIQATVAAINLAFLKLPLAKAKFDDIAQSTMTHLTDWKTNPPFFLSKTSIAEINEIYTNAAAAGIRTAGPAVLAWCMIMFAVREFALRASHERELQQIEQHTDTPAEGESPISQQGSVATSSEFAIFEDAIGLVKDDIHGDDFVQALFADVANECNVFEVITRIVEALESLNGLESDRLMGCWVRGELLNLLRSSVELLGYAPEVISATLVTAAMSGDLARIACDPRAVFADDTVFSNMILTAAKCRFPYEATNFIKVCRVLTGYNSFSDDGLSFAAQYVADMRSYTQMVPDGFVGYQPIREDENANYVQLREALPMVEILPSLEDVTRFSGTPQASLFRSAFIPPRLLGQVINDTRPAVIMWHHRYNGIGFLGSCLERVAHDAVPNGALTGNTITEIIGLFADLLEEASNRKIDRTSAAAGAKRALEMASDDLRHYGDIVSLILDIFERELQDLKYNTDVSPDLSLSVACLRFTTGLLKVLPGRVWPFLARSSFLGSNGRGGILAHIVSAIEVISGDFPFLLATVKLFQALVDDSLTHSALRRLNGKISSSSKHVADFTAGVPAYVMRQILFTLTRMMVDTYNVNTTWRFCDQSQQLLINCTLASSFEKILWYAYGIDDREHLDQKITGVFSVSAQYLFTVLRPTQAEGFPLHPILNSLFAGLESPLTVSNASLFTLRVRQTRATLRLSERLVQVGKYLNMPVSPFETQLFGAVPLLIRLYIVLNEYKLPVARVLSLLVSHASEDHTAEPPSLFGSLGAEATCRFLDCLSQFDRPFDNPALRSKIWGFLSNVISSRQQWIAVFLLTGASPRRDLNDANTNKKAPASPRMLGKAFMASALDIISEIDTLAPATVLLALEFVATAQEHWPWVTPELAKRDGLFTKILKYITSIEPQKSSIQKRCLDTKIAASVADICSMYIFSAKEARDINFFKTLRPAISWYSNNAIAVSGYNASLHSNLKKNFEMKYPHFKLTDIKRTVLESTSLDESSFYDLRLGNEFFGYDFAWSGSSKGSLVQELERANTNLLLVESQKKLLQSFKFLAIEHCASFIQDREIQRAMANVVRQCLASNALTSFNEPIFASLHQSRADFALVLLQRLVEVNARGSEVFQLLNVAWDTIRVRHPTYESALTGDDKFYFTTLLEILYLTLQFHTEKSKRGSPEGVSGKPDLSSDLPTVVEVVKVIVVDGFRALTTHLHEESQTCSPRDFALLNAIFESVLQVKDIDRVMDQISFNLLEGDTPRYAVTLFSWATKFTINNDPIYGELSLLFLLQMSSIPAVAEQLAVENVFMKLSTCQLTKLLCSQSGCGPFDQIPRFFAIWSGGILPLCLSVLFHTNGAAPEIVTFLNQFNSQLNRSADSLALSKSTSLLAFRSDESASLSERISLSMVCEISHLALLTCIIRRLRTAGAAIAFDPQLLDDLKWDKAQVKMDVESLLEKRPLLRTRITPTDEKESRMLRRKAVDPNSDCQNELEERVVKELRNTLMCLSDGENLAN